MKIELRSLHVKEEWVARIICCFCFLLWFSLYCICRPTLRPVLCNAGYFTHLCDVNNKYKLV
jgi:uncharacterized SAM-binding protein YcdF (DUF218 family)